MVGLQQEYRLLVNDVDVTEDVSGDVVYEFEPNGLATLNITLYGGSHLTKAYPTTFTSKNVIKLLDKVVFEGGAGLDRSNYGLVFRGFVKYVRPKYENSGSVSLTLECVDWSFMGSKNRNYYVYPSKKNPKSWATNNKMKVSEIIRGLVSDLNLRFAVDENGAEQLRVLYDKEFTLTSAITQKNETEWSLIRKLGTMVNCSAWVSHGVDGSYFHFVDNNYLLEGSNKGKVSFLYPAREGFGFYKKELDDSSQQIVWDVAVEHDFSDMFAIKRVTTQFDYDTGKLINALPYDYNVNGKIVTKYYDITALESDKIKGLSDEKLNEFRQLAGRIGGKDVSIHDLDPLLPYLREINVLHDRRNFLVDKAFLGIKVKFVTDGNINIIALRNYFIDGVGRYGSDLLRHSYFLRVLRHKWGSKGFLTECEFIR